MGIDYDCITGSHILLLTASGSHIKAYSISDNASLTASHSHIKAFQRCNQPTTQASNVGNILTITINWELGKIRALDGISDGIPSGAWNFPSSQLMMMFNIFHVFLTLITLLGG